MINQLDHPADQRERERERVVNLEKRLRVFSIGLIGTTIIAMGAIIFVLIRPAESATTPGTCLPIEKGGTGCDYMALRNAMGLGNSTSALPIANGGTGAMDAATARTNLGLGNLSTINSPLPIANGGSGATTPYQAIVNMQRNMSSAPQVGRVQLGNMLIQWGRQVAPAVSGTSNVRVNFPIAYYHTPVVMINVNSQNASVNDGNVGTDPDISGFNAYIYSTTAVGRAFTWLAIGWHDNT